VTGPQCWAVAFSPDGKYAIAQADYNETTVHFGLWETESWKPIHPFTEQANCVAFHPDGRHFLLGGALGRLQLMAIDAGQQVQQVRSFVGHTGWVRQVAISADGRRALSVCGSAGLGAPDPPPAGNDSTARCWGLEEGVKTCVCRGHTHSVLAGAFVPGQDRILTGSLDKTIRLWDLTSEKEVLRWQVEAPVICLAVSPDGRYALSTGTDGIVQLWRLPDPPMEKKRTEQVGAMEKQPPVKSLDPDRQAAEWVLSIGGAVRVHGWNREIKATADLPSDSFRLAGIYLDCNKQVSAAGLAHCKDCKNVTRLGLNETAASDAGLAYFKDCKDLTYLNLDGTQVSDAGLASIKDCKKLTFLALSRTQVSDVGLVHCKGCKSLNLLNLAATQVSDAGLAYFKDCKDLTYLHVAETQVSNDGLALFKDCKNLTFLALYRTQVTDAGLAHFKDCKDLKELYLQNTQVSDTGVAYFMDCKDLTHLCLQKTNVTRAKVEELKKALPKCQIEWDDR
jgi:WD40 repeat protein/uncharacterized membrane protein